jgi:hypothetical protein
MTGESEDERKNDIKKNFVFEIDFMVKLLRACVWMPWHKQAMKDVVSCDKLRGDANSLRSGDF